MIMKFTAFLSFLILLSKIPKQISLRLKVTVISFDLRNMLMFSQRLYIKWHSQNKCSVKHILY